MSTPVYLRALGLVALLPSAAAAQQFIHQVNWIPGPNEWTEGVEPADVDNDGDIDLFFADGRGFASASAGGARQNILVINNLHLGPGNFTDESVARLGVHTSYARSVAAGDIQGDGWVDALYSNGFNQHRPFLYVNRGAAQPGFFDFEGVARGFNELLSSANAQFGDVDNDGDLDVMICDVGNSYLGGAGDRPNLYMNDGTGNFTEAGPLDGWNPPIKAAHMAIHFADLDNDWDLDFFGPNRDNNANGYHYLMFNDGAGAFTDSSSIVPVTSSSVYEADLADLDGDTDLDMFFVSSSGFSEGAMRNNFVPSGTFSLTKGATIGGQDDNEVAYVDYDMDGDMDAIIGSLGSTEKVEVNNGLGVFTNNTTIIQTVGDSTLDVTVADMNGDGAYDIITGQGESNQGQWRNKIYLNNGSVDTTAPIIQRTEALDGDLDAPWAIRAQIVDSVQDDRTDWLTVQLDYVMTSGAARADVVHDGGGFVPNVLNVAVGTTVTWTNASGVDQSVMSTTAPYGYDSGTIGAAGTYAYTFVSPGTYDYMSSTGATGQVVVTGSTDSATMLHSGISQYRASIEDTSGGSASHVAYEWRATDWNGNVAVSEGTKVYVGDCGFEKYGVGISTGNPLDLTGGGSTSIGAPFTLTMTGIDPLSTFGTYLFSSGEDSIPLFDGIALVDFFGSLVVITTPAAGGTSVINGNIPSNPNAAGVTLYAQGVSADTTLPQNIAFSNGVRIFICP